MKIHGFAMLGNNDVTQKVSFPERGDAGRASVAANFVSTLFSPALTVFYGVILCSSSVDHPSMFLWTFYFMLLFVLPPTAYILYLMRRGEVTDFHMSVRGERVRPLCVVFLYTLFAILLYRFSGGPDALVMMGFSGLVALGFVTLISLYWKVSGHCAAMGGLSAVAFGYHDSLVLVLLSLAFLVTWSRIRLGRHTPLQTLAGFSLGAAIFGLLVF